MNKTTKKLKKLEKKFHNKLEKDFGKLRGYYFLGDMNKGNLAIVITAKEKK